MPKLNAQAMSERRRAITQAAYRCFVREGYAAASVDSICAEAGISKGAFYVHFASKEALIHAVAELRAEEIPPLGGDTLRELADQIIDTMIVPMLARDAALFELGAVLTSAVDPVLSKRLAANLVAIAESIKTALDRIVATTGEPIAISTHAAAILIETHCLGFILKAGVWTPDPPDKARAEMRHILESLRIP